jgi:2-methylcitrate dehydratase PrpD
MNRRSVLCMMAATTVEWGLPPMGSFAQASEPGRIMNALSDYMSAARTRALPDDVTEHAKHHLLDTFAAMISGSGLLPGQAAQRYIREHGGNGTVTVLGSSLTAAPIDAALANGVMAHADETDDSHNESRSHPGCAVVPAALAVGELHGIDGTSLVRALTLGYDIGTRVVMAMGGAAFSYDSSLATHSIAGTFGAGGAAASAAGLNARQMRFVLDYTAQQSSGFIAWRRDTEHVEKAFVFAGMPARNGVTSALLVESGYAPKAQPDRLVEKLGERYEITQTDIKKWTVGSPIQAPLDGIEAIRNRRPFEADQVRHVTIRLAPSVAEVVDNRDIPDICLQHMAAVMLLDKTVSFHAAHDPSRMKDPATLRQREKVALVRDEDLAKLLPVRVAMVEIELDDGTRLSERISAVRGTPRNPMTRAEVIEKARDLTAPVLGSETSKRLIDVVLSIETVTDVRDLRPLFQRG